MIEQDFWSNITSVDYPVTNLISSVYMTNAAFLGASLNIIVIYFYSHDKLLRKRSNYLFINLAIADLFMLISTIPMTVISHFYKKWIFGTFGKLKFNLNC